MPHKPKVPAPTPAPKSGLSAELLRTLENVEAETPRYLFRGWSSISGGDSRLNTVDAITPSRFLDPDAPAAVDHLSDTQFLDLWNYHVNCAPFDTVFSSWSQSLKVALQFAANRCDYEPHVSIVDTTMLKKHNRVFYTNSVHARALDLKGYPCEFLIFGVISAEAFSSVRCGPSRLDSATQLRFGSYVGPYMPPMPSDRTSLETTLKYGRRATKENVLAARRTGKRFGAQWELAATCYALTKPPNMQPQQPEEVVAILASAYDVPRDWLNDKVFTHDSEEGGFADFPRAVRAVRLMRSVAEYKHSRRSPRSSGPTQAPVLGADTRFYTPEAIDRIPKNLMIGMVGYYGISGPPHDPTESKEASSSQDVEMKDA